MDTDNVSTVEQKTPSNFRLERRVVCWLNFTDGRR
jgi:hypothetical protein